jgi:CheY-like chemotaxis protein/predicted Zn-dependent protease
MLKANPFFRLKYLVVDDFTDMRSMIRAMLQALGAPAENIHTARNGEEAVYKLGGATRYDVVLCDYNLGPGKDGMQVLEEARYLGLVGMNSIFIMITAENSRDMVLGVIEYEPDSYISKPFNKDVLRERLLKIMERKKAMVPIHACLVGKDHAKALELINQQLTSQTKYTGELAKLKAGVLFGAGQYDDAMAIYEQFLMLRDVAWAQMGKAKVLFAKQQYVQAKVVLEHMTREYPNLMEAFDLLAKIQRIEADTLAAEETLSHAIERSPKAVMRQQELGELAMLNGNLAKAERAYEAAVKQGRHSVRKSAAAHAGLAKVMVANQKYQEALKVVKGIGASFSNNDNEASFYEATSLALIYQGQGDEAQANEQLTKAETLIGRIKHGVTGALGLELANACAQLGQQDKALKLVNSIIANNHDNDTLLGSLGHMLKNAGMNVDTSELIANVRKDVFGKNNQGVRMIRQGKLAEAVDLLRVSANELPSNKTINLNAAKAFIMFMEKEGTTTDNLRQAAECIERVRQASPDDWRLTSLTPRLQALATKF